MYSKDQRRAALEKFVELGCSYAGTIAELGYPTRQTLWRWWREYESTGEVPAPRSGPGYPEAARRRAVEHYLANGRCLALTMRELGYPKNHGVLCAWIDELAPGQRKRRAPSRWPKGAPREVMEQAAAQLEAGTATAEEIAERCGVSWGTVYAWRREVMGDNGATREKGGPMGNDTRDSKGHGGPMDMDHEGAKASGAANGNDENTEASVAAESGGRGDPGDLPDDVGELRAMIRKLQLELDVQRAVTEVLKKGRGAGDEPLTNAEKAEVVTALRAKHRLCELLPAVGMAKSSYEYAKRAAERGEPERRAEARREVVEAFEASGGTYGYRRIAAVVGLGQWTVRAVMREEGLVARTARKRRRYSSYEGETSDAPPNLLCDGSGRHCFRAGAPNELWVTDVTEFSIPAGKVYLSPVIDCFDGMPVSWSISTSPDAEMANSSLLGACAQLAEGEHPKVHTDRGAHYRWPGWDAICREHGLVRSMSRKACSPDNARCEGFFGRLKVEFFHGRDWSGVTVDEFCGMLDGYLRWYRDERVKSDLGYRSPAQYRRDLGLVA